MLEQTGVRSSLRCAAGVLRTPPFSPQEKKDGHYKVFERPGLQEFLDYLFANFNVSVWTAASKSYALFIIDKYAGAGYLIEEMKIVE